jgi:Protein of unknown function (DUF4011)/AAA domain/REase_MTES_1575
VPLAPPVPIGTVDIELDAIDTFYYAVAHRPVVRALTIRNRDVDPIAGDLLVRIFVDGGTPTPLLHERTFEIPALAINDSKSFRAIRIEPNHRELALLDEQITADLTVEVSVGGRLVGVKRQPIAFLAYNQWMHRLEFFDSYASFVMPNHPMLSSIMDRARTLLGERTGSSATDGYQSGDPTRIENIARAAFDALCETRLNYANPPASFEGFGQKIRTPDVVFQDRCATCLDSSVLYASCLAAAGLDPVLVLSKGHAFAGYWTRSPDAPVELTEPMRRPVVDNRNDIAALIAAGALQPVETTCITVADEPRSFDLAIGTARSLLTNRLDEVEALVNVAAARAAGVRPIPTRRVVNGVVEIEQPPVAQRFAPLSGAAPTAAPLSSKLLPPSSSSAPPSSALLPPPPPPAAAARLGAFDAPARIRSWLSSLLDLSFANPLISLKTGRGTFKFELPPGMLAGLEDRVMGADSFIELLPASKVPARILDEESLDDALIVDFATNGRIYFPNVATLEPSIDAVKRKALEQDPALPPATAQRAAEAAVAAEMQQQLDTSIAALRRKAREIESQTGSNNLFLTIGALQWTEPPSAGMRKREGMSTAPLFLIPIRITGTPSTSYRITADEGVEVTPNYCMLEKLRQTFDLVIPELETPDLDGSGIDVTSTLAAVRKALGEKRLNDVIVQESAHLAVLNFATFRLWKDMRDHWQQFVQNDVVRHLVERPYEAFENAEAPAPTGELLCPIEIDESQLQAVTWAVGGHSFVIEGPPGTGKSQTITNLLAASIAANKKVLFVAQKQPALQVVKKRLEQIGLTPFCIDLHDKGSKPEQIRKQVRDALDFGGVDREAEWNELTARLAADDQALTAYRSVIHTPNSAGYSAWSARQDLVEMGPGPAIDVPVTFLGNGPDALGAVRDSLLAVPSVAASVRRQPGGPWSLAASVDFATIDQSALTALANHLQTLLDSLAALPGPIKQALARMQGPADLDTVLIVLDAAALGPLPNDQELATIGTPAWNSIRDATRQRLDAFSSAVAPLLAVFNESIFAADLRPIVQAGADAVGAGFLSRSKRERAFTVLLTPFLRADSPASAVSASPEQLLTLVQQVDPARAEAAAVTAQIAAVPGARLPVNWSPLGTLDVTHASSQLARLADTATVMRSPVATAVRTALSGGWVPTPLFAAQIVDTRHAWDAFATDLGVTPESLQRWRNGRGLFEAWAASNPAWIQAAPRFLDLQRWCELLATLAPLGRAGLDTFSNGILDGSVDPEQAYDQFRRGLVTAALDERLEAGRVDQFDGLAHDRRVQSYIGRAAQRRELMRTVIPNQLARQRPFKAGARFGDYGALERELSKTTRRLSIRKLIERYGEILPGMTPCFLMSPDSVARFIPPGSITFDLVVFDEASQIEVAEAIGAMGRAKAVVVVGDSRQMPPSKFGGTVVDADSASADLDGGAESDDAVFEDLESILSECVESNLPRLYLQCHYRSRHEALIAFSNAAFYEGKLTTFPSPFADGPPPIHWRRIDGHFDRSGTGDDFRTNRAEATAIVDDIARRLHDPATSSQSICVVTLNVQQQGLVYRLLEASDNERIRALLDDETDSGLIVRNLESVQGDERDVVLISIAFAPILHDAAGGAQTRRLPLNFGPLNRKGGERRLNVAVTRARSEVTVFCSFDPEEMRLSENPAKGLELLKQYLSIARDGSQSGAAHDGAATSGDLVAREPTAPDHHRSAIAAALRERGLRVRENVGLSKFRIDLTVGTASGTDWDVAVLLDGPGWASRTTVYDRDALPPNVLTIMGWPRIVRVWLPSWIQEPERVLDQIAGAVEAANVIPPPPPLTAPPLPAPLAGTPFIAPFVEPLAAPPPAPPTPVVAGLERPFTPATTRVLGEREVLDRLDDPAAIALVRSAIYETMVAEAPIHATRLAKIVMTRFGFDRVTPKRSAEILDLATEAQVRRWPTGVFLWSSNVDATTWRNYRRTPAGTERKLEHVAPEEITNAMLDIAGMSHTIDRDELLKVVAEIFGSRKLTPAIRTQLEDVLVTALASGQLVDDGGRLRVNRA